MGKHRRRRKHGHRFGPTAPATGSDSSDSVSQPSADSVSNEVETEDQNDD